jgi:hypothetical protein
MTVEELGEMIEEADHERWKNCDEDFVKIIEK